MLKIAISSLLMLLISNSYALEKCQYFFDPQGDTSKLNIIEGDTLSFKDCPREILVSNKYVGRLYLVEEIDGKDYCTYSYMDSNLIKCKK